MLSKIFKAYDIRGTYPDQVNADAAWRIGFGTGQFLKDHPQRPQGEKGQTVLVSQDMRTSSPELATALSNGLRAAGFNVIDLGMCDTSIMYFAVNHFGCAGGIQTTASHNPPQYNGFKISAPLAKPIGGTTGLPDIQKLAEKSQGLDSIETAGSYEEQNIWAAYRKHVLQFLTPPAKPIKIFVDASNGMAGKMMPLIFKDIPNLQFIELNYEITGSFVHEPNPLVAENMIPTQQGVVEHHADFGACFDGDADRCMVTDEKGEIIGCDILTAMLSEHFIKQEPAGSKPTVIYDLRSSKVVEQTITQLGGTPVKSRVGHVFMKQILRETDGVFGGELSGHFYFRGNYYADSGAIALAAIISVLGQTDQSLSDWANPFKKYPQSGEINFETPDKDAVLAQIKNTYASSNIDELDGITVDSFETDGWWFNIRASNTEPLLRLNAEAKDPQVLEQLMAKLTPMLGTQVQGH